MITSRLSVDSEAAKEYTQRNVGFGAEAICDGELVTFTEVVVQATTISADEALDGKERTFHAPYLVTSKGLGIKLFDLFKPFHFAQGDTMASALAYYKSKFPDAKLNKPLNETIIKLYYESSDSKGKTIEEALADIVKYVKGKKFLVHAIPADLVARNKSIYQKALFVLDEKK